MRWAPQFDQQEIARILAKQDGVISRAQITGLGMSPSALHQRIRPGGPWQVLLPGVYLAQTGRPTADQRETGALVYAGPHSYVTGTAALARHGVRVPASGQVDVLIPAERRRRDAGFVRIQRTRRPPGAVREFGPVRCVPADRAVADLARRETDLATVRAVVADAVQRGKVFPGQLAEELNSGPVWGSARLRMVLAEVADGVRSGAEADLRTLIRRSGLPAPLYNPWLYAGDEVIGRPDAWWPWAWVAVEVESRAWHLVPADWERTLTRDARMSACGIVVLHFSPQRLRAEGSRVVAEIRSALSAGRPRGSGIRTVSASELVT